MQCDENSAQKRGRREQNTMKLEKVEGIFSCTELAELAAGRIRRSVRGVHGIHVIGQGNRVQSPQSGQRYTMLPANLRMQNYVTAVMVSEISDDVLPEPMYRRSVRLLLLCEPETAGKAAAILQAVGAENVKKG